MNENSVILIEQGFPCCYSLIILKQTACEITLVIAMMRLHKLCRLLVWTRLKLCYSFRDNATLDEYWTLHRLQLQLIATICIFCTAHCCFNIDIFIVTQKLCFQGDETFLGLFLTSRSKVLDFDMDTFDSDISREMNEICFWECLVENHHIFLCVTVDIFSSCETIA